jgi:hypothetical protein
MPFTGTWFDEEGDVSNTPYRVSAPVWVDMWRVLQPGDAEGTACDKTAADIMEVVMKDSYWTTNTDDVGIDAVASEYLYLPQGLIMVRVEFELEFTFNKKDQ